jgi:formate dehydrogenase maturation protein FdhE
MKTEKNITKLLKTKMWKDIRKMTREEIVEELEALKQVRELSTKVSVDKLLNQELDLEPLRKVNLTMTANGSLYYRTVRTAVIKWIETKLNVYPKDKDYVIA